MKKVLVAFDGGHFSDAVMNFLVEMNASEPIMLKGIFLPSVDYSAATTYFGNPAAAVYMSEYENEDALMAQSVGLFERFCHDHHLHHKVHKHIHKPIADELYNESRYGDLLVIDSTKFYENLGKLTQEEYLEDTLHKAECPVLLLPGAYTKPEEIILAYDGSVSSMYAIKQFVYLFPDWTDVPTTLVYANADSNEIPFLPLLKEYMTQHFSRVVYDMLEIDPKKYFDTWLENRKQSILVSGAYGRSAFSELFRHNFLRQVVDEHKVPLFVAHY